MPKKFSPIPMMCGDCGHPLQSIYPGQFASCPEHNNFVDQTSWYERHGGSVLVDRELMQEIWEETCEFELDLSEPDEERVKAVIEWAKEMNDLWGDADEETHEV